MQWDGGVMAVKRWWVINGNIKKESWNGNIK